MNRPLTHALLCAAALLTHLGAHAGELTLFEDDNFRGRALTVRETTDDLSRMGFNDKVSSIMVRSGTWDVCTDSGFRGNCKTLTPGEYRSMPGMNDAISSVREVGRYDGRGDGHRPDRDWGHGNDGRRASLEVYSGAGQNGGSARLDRDNDNFATIGFNDRTTSIVIGNGYWQLCSDANYQGTCRIFGPGRHDDLGRGLDGKVSSARMVDEREARRQQQYEQQQYQQNQYQQYPQNQYPQYPQQQYQQRGAILLFPDADMRGEPLALDRNTEDLVRQNFNDRAGSIVVNEGQWEVCSDSNFRGRCEVIGPGQYARLNALDNKISSLRRVR
ncbi:beta/gamma crystallin-related protein [Janthinobacterium sp. PSPC3-1]|uniref:beta/gamma crystallin-related protein n=1 Tax=Janthinobacterium sp. PSPC3-1 TaxID=2804653 RepID=UPI003CF8BFB6